MKSKNIVHQYFKRDFDDFTIYVKVNPYSYQGTELTIFKNGSKESRDMTFDEQIFEDLAADDFKEVTSLEYQLYASGLA